MTINNDIQSLLNLEQYQHQSKTTTDIILFELTKLIKQQIKPIKLTTTTLHHHTITNWTFNHPQHPIYTGHPNLNPTTTPIKIQQGQLHLKINNQPKTYELANPQFPNNLIQDLQKHLPQATP